MTSAPTKSIIVQPFCLFCETIYWTYLYEDKRKSLNDL
jgi:hypothetical protein